MKQNDSLLMDLLGVGVGPFNLSLAALLSPIKTLKSYFFDRNEAFRWHPGLLLPHSELQVSYLKDLVTLVDPTNPYSFIAYLGKHKRLYRFINSQFKDVSRVEFNNYLHWVSCSLPNLFFQEAVEEVNFDNQSFVMRTTKRKIRGTHLVLGNGLTPYIPECAKPYAGKKLYHSEDFLLHSNWHGKRVVVVGGGQSGGEVIHHMLDNSSTLPAELTWVTKRSQFLPLDDTPFVKEFFSPNYAEYFYQLPADQRQALLQEQVVVNDGISGGLLKSIYQRLYFLECIENRARFFHLLPNYQLMNLYSEASNQTLTLFSEKTSQQRSLSADIVIFATGYRWQFPDYLTPLRSRITLEKERFQINPDFSIQWDGPNDHRIYAQNAARHTHGIAEPNLSLMAWRSAKIINSLAKSTIYDLGNDSTAMDFQALQRSYAPLSLVSHSKT